MQRAGQMRIDRRRARLIAALAGFAWLAAQFAGLAHIASAPHVECREHRELEEVATVSSPDGHAHAHTESVVEDSGVPSGGQEHEHCVLATHLRHSSATSTATAPV